MHDMEAADFLGQAAEFLGRHEIVEDNLILPEITLAPGEVRLVEVHAPRVCWTRHVSFECDPAADLTLVELRYRDTLVPVTGANDYHVPMGDGQRRDTEVHCVQAGTIVIVGLRNQGAVPLTVNGRVHTHIVAPRA